MQKWPRLSTADLVGHVIDCLELAESVKVDSVFPNPVADGKPQLCTAILQSEHMRTLLAEIPFLATEKSLITKVFVLPVRSEEERAISRNPILRREELNKANDKDTAPPTFTSAVRWGGRRREQELAKLCNLAHHSSLFALCHVIVHFCQPLPKIANLPFTHPMTL